MPVKSTQMWGELYLIKHAGLTLCYIRLALLSFPWLPLHTESSSSLIAGCQTDTSQNLFQRSGSSSTWIHCSTWPLLNYWTFNPILTKYPGLASPAVDPAFHIHPILTCSSMSALGKYHRDFLRDKPITSPPSVLVELSAHLTIPKD